MENGNVKRLEEGAEVKTKDCKRKFRTYLSSVLPDPIEARQYLGVLICGLTAWGCLWLTLGRAAAPGGWLARAAGVAAGGFAAGHALARLTTLPPLVGMTLFGALCRNVPALNFHTLEHAAADALDYHLRRIYPVVILTKGPLGWDWDYIKANYVLVFALASLPWIVEWLSITTLAYYIMDFPWKWGIHLGSIIASVSPAVVVPTVVRLGRRGYGAKRDISKLVACAGGLDTALTEGAFGVINAAIFVEASDTYRVIKGVFAVLAGVALGVAWGVLADLVPAHGAPLAAALKSGLVFWGGLLLMYGAGQLGWGGTAGVAVMVCAATAATRWRRRGWQLAQHPVAEVFRVLWNVFEPMLFSLSGYYFELDNIEWEQLARIVACLAAALAVRMGTALLVALAGGLSTREGLFVSITWMPKAIVEAVLVRVALDSLPPHASAEDRRCAQEHAVLVRVALDSLPPHASAEDRRCAQEHVNVIVIAIVLTSSLGSALTTVFGPILLKRDLKICPSDGPVQEPPGTMQKQT